MGRGQYDRPYKKRVVEDCGKLSIFQLYHHGMLVPADYRVVRGGGGGPIVLQAEPDRLWLAYKGWTGEHVVEKIALTSTSCHYGGERPWFVCPGCGCRVGVLYQSGRFFRCRGCHRLAYQSQRESPMSRSLSKFCKIRASLGGANRGGALPSKPPRMWWRTYDRLVMKAQEALKSHDVGFREWMNRFRRS